MTLDRSLLLTSIIAALAACGSLETGTSEGTGDDGQLLGQTFQGLASGNLVTNGHFNNGTTSWNLVGPVGVDYSGGFPSAPEGAGWPNGAGGTLALWQDLGTQPAGSYTLSGWIKTSNLNQAAWIRTDNGYPGQPGGIIYCSTASVSNTYWTQVNCFFTLSSSAPVHVALVAWNTSAAVGGWVVWDSILLIRDGNDWKLPWPAAAGRKCITNTYGEGEHVGTDQYAIDFTLYYENVSAAKGGYVAEVNTDENHSSGYGRYVLLSHSNSTLFSLYAHLSSVSVKSQDPVTKGQIIGVSGATGNVTGPHLHFRLRDASANAVKPEPMSGLKNFDNAAGDNLGACYSSNN